MNTRIAITAMLLAAWVLWSPLALAAHMAAGSRPMCAADSSETHDPDSHKPGHGANTMNGTAGKLCSLGVCTIFLSPSESMQFHLTDETYVQRPLQNLLMVLPQIPDPVPKALHFLA